MKTAINSQGFELNDYWNSLIEKKTSGLGKLTERFGPETLLKVALVSLGTHHEKGGSLKVKLSLDVLKETLIAEEEGDEVKRLLDKCVKTLKAQLVAKKEKKINQKRTSNS